MVASEPGRGRQMETEGDRGRQGETEGDRGRQRETEGDRGRQRKTESCRERILSPVAVVFLKRSRPIYYALVILILRSSFAGVPRLQDTEPP